MTLFMTKMTSVLTALMMLLSGGKGAVEMLEYGSGVDSPVTSEEEILSPTELCKEITIGWNLGNTLDATGGSGLSTETSWGNPKATEELILAVKDAGFNAVRIPTTWYKHMDDDYNIDKEWMDRVQEVVDYAYDNGMYVILNSHHENWNYPYEDNLEKGKKILNKLWTQVAERFKDYDQRLIFEGMNEPRKVGTTYEWNGGDKEGRQVVNRFNEAFIAAVRVTGGNNLTRCLMIPTYAATSQALNGFTVPDDDYLIVSIHAYTPYNFAMATGGNWATDNFSEKDPNSTNELKWLSDELNKRFVSKGVGAVIGECGATDKGNLDQRINWARYFPKVFGQYDIPVFLWDNGAFGTGGEKYGLIDRYTLKWKYKDYIDALVKSAENA